MGYLIGEILICLILAALIGALMAWLLRGVRYRAREKALLDELKQTHAKMDAAEGELRSLEASQQALRNEMDTQTQRLRARLGELEPLEALTKQREERIETLESQLAQLREAKEIELKNLRQHLETLEPLQGQLDKSQAERNRLQGELQTLKDQLQSEEQRLRGELESTLSAKDAEIERLNGQLGECEALRSSLNQRDEELAECQKRCIALERDKNLEIADLAKRVAEHAATIERLESEASSGEQAAARQETRQQELPGALPGEPLFQRPAEKDDLKQIRGIGPVLEETLNRLGVTTFAQIGRFSRADIERVSAALEVFADRILRDDWIGGAREAYRKKYGRRLD